MENILTVAELAKDLGVKAATIRKYALKGKIKGFKRFRNWYFKKEDVLKFIEEGSNQELDKNEST